jgi:hypothetical protein
MCLVPARAQALTALLACVDATSERGVDWLAIACAVVDGDAGAAAAAAGPAASGGAGGGRGGAPAEGDGDDDADAAATAAAAAPAPKSKRAGAAGTPVAGTTSAPAVAPGDSDNPFGPRGWRSLRPLTHAVAVALARAAFGGWLRGGPGASDVEACGRGGEPAARVAARVALVVRLACAGAGATDDAVALPMCQVRGGRGGGGVAVVDVAHALMWIRKLVTCAVCGAFEDRAALACLMPTALAACCGFDLCHQYILFLYLCICICIYRHLPVTRAESNGYCVFVCVCVCVYVCVRARRAGGERGAAAGCGGWTRPRARPRGARRAAAALAPGVRGAVLPASCVAARSCISVWLGVRCLYSCIEHVRL